MHVGIIISIPTTTPHHARANELRYQALICESILLVIEAFKQGVELHDVGAYDRTPFRGTLALDLERIFVLSVAVRVEALEELPALTLEALQNISPLEPRIGKRQDGRSGG